MAFYHGIKAYSETAADGVQADYPDKQGFIAERLLKLRADLNTQILADRKANSLIIGSWNIRAFDDGRARMDESFHYIAEIIDHFDICAVQEVKSDLAPLRRLMRLLGPNWDFFVSDVTDGGPGNRERMAFLYNTNKVHFRNLIGELVLPKTQLIDGEDQLARSPFFASFQAGWFRFTLCSAHIVYGGMSKAELALRGEEIDTISEILKKRSEKNDEVYVFLGDLNIENVNDAMFAKLTDNGLSVPLFGTTNLGGTKHYDQIAFTMDSVKTNILRHGSFDWRNAVFREDDKAHYEPHATAMRGEPYANWDSSYKGWTTYEMSDHLPIWIELKVDYSNDYLGRFIGA